MSDYLIFWKSFLVGISVGTACALVGVFLILNRLSLLGASLSHASFGYVALAHLLGVNPFIFSIVSVLVTGNVMRLLIARGVPADAVNALVFSLGVAVAVLIAGFERSFSEGLLGYMFGNILLVTDGELILSLIVSLTALVFLLLNLKGLLALIFSPEMAKFRGVKGSLLEHGFISVACGVVVLAMKVAGVVLASSLTVLPALSALTVARSFKETLLLSVLFSWVSVTLGLLLAIAYNLPPSGAFVILMSLIFALSLFFRRFVKFRRDKAMY